ncbi:6-phosphogluconolactonase [Colletotrichum tofieldiae]|nr:6-phosphogluconolactonase [Colletotrichum tofieldiae]
MSNKQPNLFAYPSVDELAPALRSYVIQAQNAGLSRHGAFKVAISGGSLPKTLAQALLSPSSGPDDQVHFGKWEVFFADEQGASRQDPEDLGAPTVHPIDTTYLNDTQELADQYEKTLVTSFASRDSSVPGHELLRETTAWVAPIEDSPKPPPKRITLTLPVVNHGVKIAFVATGGGKKDIMKRIFEHGDGLPCALVNEGAGDRVSWFVDNAAVEGVSYPRRPFL